MIIVVDYGAGNLRSVETALEAVGEKPVTTEDPAMVLEADKIILPGVGAFGHGMAGLQRHGLVGPIREAAAKGVPLLGICLGMQLLFEESYEMGQHTGLGILSGPVIRFPEGGLKVPHVGWNQIYHDSCHPLLADIVSGSYVYFVHSYYCVPTCEEVILATTDYGCHFASVIGRNNVFGVQFHPEKSHSVGLQLLQNFVAMECL